MKRIASLSLAALLGLGFATAASAAEIKVKGYYDFAFGMQSNSSSGNQTVRGENFYDNDGGDSSVARQRFRTQIDIIASEALKGVLYFEIDQNWGRNRGNGTGNQSGGQLGADGVNIKTRRAYIDWFVPETDLNFRIGIQGLALPGAVAGSPVFDDDVAAFVGSYKFSDEFALTAFWARPYDTTENDGWDNEDRNASRDEMDMFGLIAPITLDGYNITPWVTYATIGAGSGYNNTLGNQGNQLDDSVWLHGSRNPAYAGNGNWRYNSKFQDVESSSAFWVGSAFEVNVFDPIVFKADVMYGSMSMSNAWQTLDYAYAATDRRFDTRSDFKSRGWFLDAALDYKADWGTPGIFGWYSTGDDLEDVIDGKLGRMPTMPGSTPNFKPGSFGFDGSQNTMMTDSLVTRSGIGFWGIGAQVKDLTFLEDLKHTVRVLYYAGTNDQDIASQMGNVSPFGLNGNDLYLGTSENVFEINFDHTYKIYENLQLVADLSYLHLSLDEDRGYENGDRTAQDWSATQDAWKAQFGFRYSF